MKTVNKLLINVLTLAIVTCCVTLMALTTKPSYASIPTFESFQHEDDSGKEDIVVHEDNRCSTADDLLTWEFELEVKAGDLLSKYTIYRQNGNTLKVLDDSLNNSCTVVTSDINSHVQIHSSYANFNGGGYIECVTPSRTVVNNLLSSINEGHLADSVESNTIYTDVEFHRTRRNRYSNGLITDRTSPLVHISAVDGLKFQPHYMLALYPKNNRTIPSLFGLQPTDNVSIIPDSFSNDFVEQIDRLHTQRLTDGKISHAGYDYNTNTTETIYSPISYDQPHWSTDSQLIRIGYSPDGNHLVGNIRKVVVDPCYAITGE